MNTKKKGKIVAIALLVIFVLSSVLPMLEVYAATTESIILESNLYQALKKDLKKQGINATYNDLQYTISISNTEIAKVTTLQLSNSSITNLKGLEKFSRVSTLDLSANKLTDDSNLEILNSLPVRYLDLSSNELTDISALKNIEAISTLNLHNQVATKVEIIDNSLVADGVYEYQCELPQIVKDFAKPIKSEWLDAKYNEKNPYAELKFKFSAFDSKADSIPLTIGNDAGTAYTGLATLQIKINDMSNLLYNSDITINYVIINQDQRGVVLKDKKLYQSIQAQLIKGQTINDTLKTYTDVDNLYKQCYEKEQILIIDEDDIVNKIKSLELSNKQIESIDGLEEFVGLEKNLDVSSNYIKTIDTIVDLQNKKDEEENKLKERVKAKTTQLKERVDEYENLKKELEEENKKKLASELPAGSTETPKDEAKVAALTASITKASKRIMDKQAEIYETYNQIYRLTAVITPELKDITDDEYKNLTLEKAKELLQAQVTKINSIERYFTAAEKTWLSTKFGITYPADPKNDDERYALSTYFKDLLKDFEEAETVTIKNYKDELSKLRSFDSYVMYSSSYLISQKNTGTGKEEHYQVDIKTVNGETTDYITAEKAGCDKTASDDKILLLFSRIANVDEDEIQKYIIIPRLYDLSMSENLVENIDEIGIMKELKKLTLTHNEIVSVDSVQWKDMKWLSELDLTFNNISNIKALEDIVKLEKLSVAKNLISGSLDFTINDIDKLKLLDLSSNQIDNIENFVNQFEFMAKDAGKEINEFVKDKLSTIISLNGQDLSMNVTVNKDSKYVKVNLPMIFRQLENIDWENTSFGISSYYGNVSSDGTYVILQTPTSGTRTAVVSVMGDGIGKGTECTIEYKVVGGAGEGTGTGETTPTDSIKIDVKLGKDSSIVAVKNVHDMNYLIVVKDTKVGDILNDVTVNSDSCRVVLKDASNTTVQKDTDKVETNQIVVLDGLSDKTQCVIVVKGDLTGSGDITMGDILKLNQAKNGKVTLTDAEMLAGNVVDSDDEITMSDILKLNQYRLNKISEI